jgi:hypothetical protein
VALWRRCAVCPLLRTRLASVVLAIGLGHLSLLVRPDLGASEFGVAVLGATGSAVAGGGLALQLQGASNSLPIPSTFAGDIVLQGFALGGSGGSLTNPLAFTIR